MIVLVLSAVPEGLRGHVTRWLMEISPGVFVGTLSARVRERLWDLVTENMKAEVNTPNLTPQCVSCVSVLR